MIGDITPFGIALFSIILLLAATVAAISLSRYQRALISITFSLTAISCLMASIAGIWGVGAGYVESTTISMGIPDLPFHLRLDPLSGFFLVVVGLLSFFVSVYSLGYVKGFIGHRSVTHLVIFYCLFITGMFLVILSDDALSFLISWELMAASSYFLVMFEDERVENRRAAFLYLVVAHIGAIAILLSFGILAGLTTGFKGFDGYTFDAMRQAEFPAGWATAAFLLAFFGFAAKAGVIPFHVWLPEAHPVAPSNVSALMSGVMLKTAIYGIVRVSFDLIGISNWWWGAIVLIFGLISAVLGVLYALMQHDLKRLLAYHSVENIGIILIGIGLAMIFTSFKLPVLAALALIAGLYHTLNHAMFKGLLFMGAGAILHATKERNMEEMGGLIHKMPWTAALFLIGSISISALPPFNGFVSEWLTFQAFLLTPALPNALLNLLIPLGAALLALAAALAAACFVKAYGVTFLGHWRGYHDPHAHEVDWFMRIGMIMAALACLILGVLPTYFIQWMDIIPEQLVGSNIATSAGEFGWLWLTPIAHERASYSAPIVLIVVLAVVLLAYILLHIRKAAVHRAPLWDCGFEKITNRMQYNAASFSMPIRRIFGFLFSIREDVRAVYPTGNPLFPKRLRYHLKIRDHFWGLLYKPVVDASIWISRKVGKLQQGQIQMYLIYSFITIIVLLLFLR
ncbi:MAG: hydrogenase 4 subunit B [Nitrospirae bacterium]|nr:hydrogenase 4 subunit B [Nitrospirota bacterium]